MYNLGNLNDYEFEILGKDIMEKKLNKKLRVYKSGRDGGIDINAYTGKDVIIQVKHLIKSAYSTLRTALKLEVDKVEILNPEQYYIFTSQQLSVGNIKEIYELFKDYMESSENIMDGTQIDEFLKLESNIDIVKRNYKLWLTSTNVLEIISSKNIFIDSEELIYEIEKESKFYVETSFYTEAKKILNKEKVIIIQGDPGVGKSTLSKMIILSYIVDGYSVRYSTDNKIGDIKKAMSLDLEKKEVVLLDDFLGQHYLKIRDNQPAEIKTLITFVRRHINKKLILNTRITILNEAKRQKQNFKDLLDDKSIRQYLINLNDMKKEEKAKILYNHIYFNNLPYKYFDEIKKEKRYTKIIEHKNYNPRIIEHITKERNYKAIQPAYYFPYIINKLDNPEDVWDDEFVNRIEKVDRELMNTIYSLTNNYIENNILKECFYKRIAGDTITDSTLNIYDIGITRLSDSLIRIVDDNGTLKIGVLNPSINDYIHAKLEDNFNEILNIINSAIYIEQILKFVHMNDVNEWIKNNVVSKALLKLKTQSFSIEYYYLKFIADYDILDEKLECEIKRCLENSPKNLKNREMYKKYSNVIANIFSGKFINFYKLKSLIFNMERVSSILEAMEITDLIEVIKYINESTDLDRESTEELIEGFNYTVEAILHDMIIEEITCEYKDNLEEIILEIINNTYNIHEISVLISESIVEEKLIENIEEDVETYANLIRQIPNFEIKKININAITKELDYTEILKSYLEGEPDPEPDDDYDEDYRIEYNEDEVIECIFEREY